MNRGTGAAVNVGRRRIRRPIISKAETPRENGRRRRTSPPFHIRSHLHSPPLFSSRHQPLHRHQQSPPPPPPPPSSAASNNRHRDGSRRRRQDPGGDGVRRRLRPPIAAGELLLRRLLDQAPPLRHFPHRARRPRHQQADGENSHGDGSVLHRPQRPVRPRPRSHIPDGRSRRHLRLQRRDPRGLRHRRQEGVAVDEAAAPSHHPRHDHGGRVGGGHRRRRRRGVHRPEGQLPREVEQDMRRLRQLLPPRGERGGRLPYRLHRPRPPRYPLCMFPLPPGSLITSPPPPPPPQGGRAARHADLFPSAAL